MGSSNKINLNETTVETIIGLHSFFNNYKKVIDWLKFENLNLGGSAPITLINNGREQKVLQFVNTALDENNNPSLESKVNARSSLENKHIYEIFRIGPHTFDIEKKYGYYDVITNDKILARKQESLNSCYKCILEFLAEAYF